MKTTIAVPADGVPAAAALLSAGEIVGLPTETVYGLGADALNAVACAKVFEAKGRPLSDPLIVHVGSLAAAERIAVFGGTARRLAQCYWPGPLTLVLPRRDIVPDIVTAGHGTVAVRVSSHPVFQEIIARFDGPVAAPSANRFGRISPTTAGDVVAELDGRVSLVVDGGPCAHGIESAIVHVDGEDLSVLRNGPVTREELEGFGRVAGRVGGVVVPGALKSHYAPRTPLVIVGDVPAPQRGRWLLAWRHDGAGYDRVERLSRSGDLREAAANLFGAMRRLDGAGLELIIAEALPERGLGAAIMERLHKAAAR